MKQQQFLKAVIEQSAFLKALARVSRVVEKRNTIPILGNILIEVEQDSVQLRACNLDIDLADSVKAEVASKGASTVPGLMLHDIVRKMPAGSAITIECDENVMTVKAGKSRFKLQQLRPEDFPSVTAREASHSFPIAGKDLA